MVRRMSDEGRKMLVELEGARSHAYQDVAGYWTIGVGHMLTKDEISSGKILIGDDEVRYRDGLTDEQVGKLLQQDLAEFENAVDSALIPSLAPPQFDALVSFAFNVGVRAFLRSTLLKKVNKSRFAEVPRELRRWIYAGGRTWDGLVRRREVEIERWQERTA